MIFLAISNNLFIFATEKNQMQGYLRNIRFEAISLRSDGLSPRRWTTIPL